MTDDFAGSTVPNPTVPNPFPSELPGVVPLLAVRRLEVHGRKGARAQSLLTDISLIVGRGEGVALWGEAGAGKSLLARVIAGLAEGEDAQATAGQILLDGSDLLACGHSERARLRAGRLAVLLEQAARKLMPDARLDSQLGLSSAASLGPAQRARSIAALHELGEPSAHEWLHERPRALSVAQAQLALIAAALAREPDLFIADEPLALLEPVQQARVIGLLERHRTERGMGLLLVTQDVRMIESSCQRMSVMLAGEIVETGEVSGVLARPRHPYTQALLRSSEWAWPHGDRAGRMVALSASPSNALPFFLPGQPPVPGRWPEGCRFHPRCPIAQRELCGVSPPHLVPHGTGADRCHLSEHARARDAWAEHMLIWQARRVA